MYSNIADRIPYRKRENDETPTVTSAILSGVPGLDPRQTSTVGRSLCVRVRLLDVLDSRRSSVHLTLPLGRGLFGVDCGTNVSEHSGTSLQGQFGTGLKTECL